MEGRALQVTMRVLFLTLTVALIPVFAEPKSSPQSSPLDTGSVAVGMVERTCPGSTAAKVEYCNRRYAAKHFSHRWQKKFCHSMINDVSNRKLPAQQGRDLIATSSKTMSSASLMAEVEALIAFKEGVIKDSLGALSSWNSNDFSACHWKGVTCDLASKSVTILELGNLELVGSISPFLGRLQSLQSLDLSSNAFTGEIPVSLHNCSYLSRLTLHGNNLTGQIPSQLGGLSNLKYLDLSDNFLLGGMFPASLGNCSQLRFLFLNFTNVDGVIPDTVGQLTHLEMMHLKATALSGSIPGSLGNCSSLIQLTMGTIYTLPSRYLEFIDSKGLTGELPMEIGSLRGLNVFQISGSEIGGHFPEWIANLTRLKNLRLFDNYFYGEIPQFLGKLPLEFFDVGVNHFTGAFPTSLLNCSDLTLLSVAANNFRGAIPPEIGFLNKLIDFELHENSFSGKIPSSFANLSSLVSLELGENPAVEAQSFPSWVMSLVDLTALHLGVMNIRGAIPADIGKLSKLEWLLLWGNSLTGPIPATIGNCTFLQFLDLDNNQLSGELPSELWHLSQLQNFGVPGNFLTGPLSPSIGNLSKMFAFDFSDNHFVGDIPTEIGSLQNLIQISLGRNGFSGFIPPSLGNISATLIISTLDLSENQISGSIPNSMGNLSGLQVLYLYGNLLQGSIPVNLMRCTQLVKLGLDKNFLSGDIPEDIGKLQSLQILDLNNNKLSGVVPDSLGRCINLVSVDLSYNAFYGVLHAVFIAQLSNSLNSLNVSHNRLSGSLPQELAKLTLITDLNFSANNFSGSIPSGLGECKGLISLDLSINNFSGSIPQALIQLKDLAQFNVSDNNLEGRIPDGGIFATSNVTPASFFGNDGLCGSILSRPCADVTAPSRSVATPTCNGFHCASIQIALGCSAAVLFLADLLLIWLFLFRKGKSDGMKGEDVMTSFERGLNISKADLVTIMARPENVIGVGAKSTVYKGILPGDKIVAIKTMNIRVDDSDHDYKQVEADLLKEAHVMSRLRHRNVLKVLGCFHSQEVVALISEFMPMASLNDQLYMSLDDGSDTCELNWDARLNIAVGVAHALVYLHNEFHEPIIHRDLKPSNIFLDEALEPKLGDFGNSRFVNPERDGEKTASTLCGTVGYIPPEYGTTTTVSTKGDVYSYGVILLELLTRRHPLPDAEGSEGGECRHLVVWVLDSFEEQTLAILDKLLISEATTNKENQIEQMMLLMRVGLLCTREEPHNRPHMTELVGMLNQITEIDSNRVGLPSVAEMAQEILVWNSPEEAAFSKSL